MLASLLTVYTHCMCRVIPPVAAQTVVARRLHMHLQGDLVLRDGAYVSEHDTFIKIDGVYVTATGRLQAVLKPVDDVQLSLQQEDLDLHTADYR